MPEGAQQPTARPMRRWDRYLPIMEWGPRYRRETLIDDALAAVIVTIMLIPQSLAYALLAGLPPEVGLYASMLPLIAYAIFGRSGALAIGPAAILSLMTAAAAGRVAEAGTPQYIGAALILALLSGVILLGMGFLRLGFLSNFLSHPVVSGFITAAGLIIAASQVKHLFGVEGGGHNLLEISVSLFGALGGVNLATSLIGLGALAFLLWARSALKPLLVGWGMTERAAALIARAGPVFAVLAGTSVVAVFGLEQSGVAILGAVPTELPSLGPPRFDSELWLQLLGSAALISLIGFVESVSVAKTFAAKRRERVDPDQELIGLGAASLTAGVSAGYPVTAGIARSAVSFDAGARTPAAGAFTALGIALATLLLTPALFYLPNAVLAATIIVAALTLVDISAIFRVWRYSRSDFAAMTGTILVTLLFGVELGVAVGVGLSVLLHLYATSRPHFAIVGQVPGTEHFRNVDRYEVVASDCVLTIRVDESLYFANANFLEDTVYAVIAHRPDLKHLVLMCPAVNRIDASAVETLEAINERLKDAGVTLHLSEVKGPVMDRLEASDFLEELTGEVFLSQFEAMRALDAACAESALARKADTTKPGERPCPSQRLGGVGGPRL